MNLKDSFTYHRPFGNQPERYEALRAKAYELARMIQDCCPPSAETTLAIRKVEESIMWANKSIACNETEPDPRAIGMSDEEKKREALRRAMEKASQDKLFLADVAEVSEVHKIEPVPVFMDYRIGTLDRKVQETADKMRTATLIEAEGEE